MKIVCDACGAKYSIADEKVRGKVFKIRCKRCSNIIVVRGDNDAAAEAAEAPAGATGAPADDQDEQKETRVFDYSGYDNPAEAAAAAAASDAIWHVVIDQEQVGPMTAADIASRFQSGQIDADSYVWHEGFSDWERLADVDEFRHLAAGDGGGDAGLFGGPDVDTSATAQNDPADVFAAATSAAPAAEPGADLFGSSPASAPAGGGDAALFGGQAAADEGPKLKGERNENSVLFSLSNLASLAGGGGDSGGGVSAEPSGGGAAPQASRTTATQEGSGLIDIRSMAQVYLGDGGGDAPAPSAGTVDDIPTFGASSFGAPASPMLLPMAPAESGNKKLLMALFGVIGLLAVVAVVLVVLVVKGGDETVAKADGENPEQPSALAGETTDDDDKEGKKEADESDEPAAADEKAEQAATPTPEPTEDKDDDKAADTKPEPEKKEAASSRPAPKKRSDSGSKNKKTTERRAPSPEPRASSGGGGCDEVTCLVEPNKACCKKYRSSGGSKSGGNSGLPERPSKSDVKDGINKIMGRVRACGGRHGGSGVVKVRVKVAGSGRVSSASPSPANALGNCVAGAVRQARFPKTQRGVTFTYPFRF